MPGLCLELRMKAAVIQMVSGDRLDRNLVEAEDLLAQAAQAGAELALLPENFALMGQGETDKLAIMETPRGEGPIQSWLSAQAREKGLWLFGGSLPLAAEAGRCHASLLVHDPSGQCICRYDKIHLFDVDLPGGESYRESRTIQPGTKPVRAPTPWGDAGLSICYDLRFPELYRQYGGVSFLMVPSAFTAQTGQAHWEVLLRARAVENQAFVLGANQGGLHANGRWTYGRSMIVDPWGNILAQLGQGPGWILAECDLGQMHQLRSSLPALQHRVLDVGRPPHQEM